MKPSASILLSFVVGALVILVLMVSGSEDEAAQVFATPPRYAPSRDSSSGRRRYVRLRSRQRPSSHPSAGSEGQDQHEPERGAGRVAGDGAPRWRRHAAIAGHRRRTRIPSTGSSACGPATPSTSAGSAACTPTASPAEGSFGQQLHIGDARGHEIRFSPHATREDRLDSASSYMPVRERKSLRVASISVVGPDARIAPRDQATWAFTDGDAARRWLTSSRASGQRRGDRVG